MADIYKGIGVVESSNSVNYTALHNPIASARISALQADGVSLIGSKKKSNCLAQSGLVTVGSVQFLLQTEPN